MTIIDHDAPDRLLHRETTQAIIGCFYSVHSQLGHGFLEAVYANSMAVMLRSAGRRSDLQVGLLFNFGPKPDFKRILFTN